MKNQKGFTLIELIIVIAILSIVSISIVGFMIAGTKSYAASSSEVNLQKEAQIVMNQLEDLIIDTSKAVTYSYQADESDSEHLVVKDSEIPTDAYAKHLCMYNGSVAYEVTWKRDDSNQLTYAEYTVVNGVKTNSPSQFLLADYVTTFAADLTDLEDNRVVQLNVDFEKAQRTYHASNNVTIRNKVVVNDLSDYEDPTVPTGTPKKITAETAVYLAPNQSYTFMKPVITGTGTPSQEVTWSFEKSGDHDAGTTISPQGTIQMAKTETNRVFRVKVSSVQNSSVSAYITVNLVRVNVITLSDEASSGGTTKYKANSQFSLKVNYSDTYNINMDATGTGTTSTVTVIAGSEYVQSLGTNSNGNETYKILEDTPAGTKLTFRAVSDHSTKFDYPDANHIYTDLTITVATSIVPGYNLVIGGHEVFNDVADMFGGNEIVYFYMMLEESTDHMETFTNVGGKYDGWGGPTWNYNYDSRYPGWYVAKVSGSSYTLNVPSDLSLDKDYRFTMFKLSRKKENGNLEGEEKMSDQWVELIPRTEITYSCTNKTALATNASKIDIHLFTFDPNSNSKTYWANQDYDIVIKQVARSVTGGDTGKFGDYLSSYQGDIPSFVQFSNAGKFRIDANRNRQYGTFSFWPRFRYENVYYDRPDNTITMTVKTGNATVNGTEVFIPYPTHPTFLSDFATEKANATKTVGWKKIYYGVGSEQWKWLYFYSTKQSDGSYKLKIYSNDNYNTNNLGTYWCAADGLEWTNVNN